MPLAKFAFLALVATILLISITSVEAGKKKKIKELKKQLAVCQEEKSNLEKELEEKEEEEEEESKEQPGDQDRLNPINTVAYYIGGTDMAREGQFNWLYRPSDLVKENFWARGQPDNWQNAEDCMTYQAQTQLWNDARCSSPLNFICRRILRN